MLHLNINYSTIFKIFFILTIATGIFILVLAVIQLNQNLSPFPSPKDSSRLIKNGMYKYIRHPIYTGILLIALGYGLYTVSGYKLLITICLLVLFNFKSKYEEQRLSLAFKDYDSYKIITGRFFPKLK